MEVAYGFDPNAAIMFGVMILYTIKPAMDVRSECLTIDVKRRLNSEDVIDRLA
jgi:uncharacterized UPF0146 family protein